MPRKMFPLEVLQHYLDDLNSFQDGSRLFEVRVTPDYFQLLVKLLVVGENKPSAYALYYQSSDYEAFCNKVSFLARQQVRAYMKDIVYPYKRKVGHATRS